MIVIRPNSVKDIDNYASCVLGIPATELMKRSADAVSRIVRERVELGGAVVILCGAGNNGGDGYALATELMDEYKVTLFDVFAKGQRTEEGRLYLDFYKSRGGEVKYITDSLDLEECISASDAVVDAIFGTGYTPRRCESGEIIASVIERAEKPFKIAIDVPIGCDADFGRVDKGMCAHFDTTVVLSFLKRGLLSYPAAEYVGKLVYDNIGLHNEAFLCDFNFEDRLVDEEFARENMPVRSKNSHKGSYGRVVHVCGSSEYRGAAILALEGALRAGAGYIRAFVDESQHPVLLSRFPEAIYEIRNPTGELTKKDIERILFASEGADVTLVGPGLGISDGLECLVKSLLSTRGGTLVLDADALNCLARNDGLESLERAERNVVITPHPLEFSRLIRKSVNEVQNDRIRLSVEFAQRYGCTVLLKGAASIITDGKRVFINSSGSSALAKAGSGDVLAGVISSFLAQGADVTALVALGAYLHGRAADTLSSDVSEFSVIPSDIPTQIGREIVKLLGEK